MHIYYIIFFSNFYFVENLQKQKELILVLFSLKFRWLSYSPFPNFLLFSLVEVIQ